MSTPKVKINKELKCKSSTDNLTLVRNFIKSTAEERGVSKETIGKIILAVDEACTNIIKHAYAYSSEGDIHLKVKTDKKRFSIEIVDSGSHFNPQVIPEPDVKKMQKAKKGGGLGMFLMKKLMDEVRYSDLGNNRNQVILVKYLN